jgi:hypothetical protein
LGLLGLAIIWYVVGLVGLFLFDYYLKDQITVQDIFENIFYAVSGPVLCGIILITVLYDNIDRSKVLISRKKK